MIIMYAILLVIWNCLAQSSNTEIQVLLTSCVECKCSAELRNGAHNHNETECVALLNVFLFPKAFLTELLLDGIIFSSRNS